MHATTTPPRGYQFQIENLPPAVQAQLREKLVPVEQVIKGLPRRFSFFSTLALNAPRGFLRKLSLRDDYEEIRYYCALLVEPYPFLMNPNVKITNAYLGALDRLIAKRMGKTVAHIPRQFIQFCETIKHPGKIDLLVASATPPDENGMMNLGVNCETIHEALKHFQNGKRTVKVFIEINSHMPWVYGGEEGYNLVHVSQVDAIFEQHEPLPQVPPIRPSTADRMIAEHVAELVEDGDTVQLGIGGVPMVVAAALQKRRNLKIHSELLTDAIVDLARSGAVCSRGKPHLDGLIVGTFAVGTDKLYDWLHRNREVALLPIRITNDPGSIARNPHMKAINSGVMVDLHGQIASDAIGFRQISGIGGQLEFVMGAQMSEGGKAIICLKSASHSRGRTVSNIRVVLPAGTPVTVPRQYADIIVTEQGWVDIRHLDAVERAHALVSIAHPDCREELIREARAAGLWERRDGFQSFTQRALYNNLRYVVGLRQRLGQKPAVEKAKLLAGEVQRLLAGPDLPQRVLSFYRQNRG